jgi:hypothetical protein
VGSTRDLGRPVAIKVSAREFSDRFEREARAISSLNHPHICTLYDVGPNYLVMEFVEGDALSKLIAQGGDPAPVVATEYPESMARVSPDGRWVAYQSTRSGRVEVYVRPFAPAGSGAAAAGPVIQISAEGGRAPKWRGDGKELFFWNLATNVLMSAEIETSNGTFRPVAPVPMGIRSEVGAWSPNRTGQKFLLAPSLDQGAQTPITVVTNWEATLKR